MKNTVLILGFTTLFASVLAAQPQKLSGLPVSLRTAIQEQTKGDTVKSISKEVEKGKTQYEVETLRTGKTRDLIFDPSGKLLSVEEETTLDAIPAPAREAIQKKLGKGKIAKVETVTEGAAISYEATYTAANGKSAAVIVDADGTVHP